MSDISVRKLGRRLRRLVSEIDEDVDDDEVDRLILAQRVRACSRTDVIAPSLLSPRKEDSEEERDRDSRLGLTGAAYGVPL